jgi:hypothetical protein
MKDCPRCTAPNPADAASCARCGAALPPEVTAHLAAQASQPPTSPPPPGILTGASSSVSGATPIRVSLPVQQPSSPASEPEAPEGIASHTALALGVVVLLSCLVAPIAVAVFTCLGVVLALLHHAAEARRRPLEAYGTAAPRGIEAAVGFLRRADGKAVLVLLMLAVAIFLAHKVVFGLAGAAAVLTALHLLDVLHKPAEGVMCWLDNREDGMRRALSPLLNTRASLLISVAAWFPALWFLAQQQRTLRSLWGGAGEPILAGGVVLAGMVAVLIWTKAVRGPRPADGEGQGGLVLVCAAVALALVVICSTVQVFTILGLALVADRALLNGLIFGMVPAVGLIFWLRNYLARAMSLQEETGTWPASAWAAVTVSVSGWLLWRAGAIDLGKAGPAPVAAVGMLSLAAWFTGSRALLACVKRDSGVVVNEWVMVFLCTMASLYVVFCGSWFGGVWGGLAACYAAVLIWKEGARILRQARLTQTESPSAARDSGTVS